MNKNIRHTEEDAERFGFRWGQLDVIRAGEFGATRIVEVTSDFGSVNIQVSKTGRSIRVFKNGVELK